MILGEGRSFRLIYKPSGWDAGGDRSVTRGSGSDSVEHMLSSGWVEPLWNHPAFCQEGNHPVFVPAPTVSGCALIADSRCAQRSLSNLLHRGHLTIYSLALVSGEVDASQPPITAVSGSGTFEIMVLAHYECASDGDWSTDGGLQRYTLLLLRATGAACGCERALVRRVWGRAVVGDAENEATDALGGRPFLHHYAFETSKVPSDHAGINVVCPLSMDLRAVLAPFTAEPQNVHVELMTCGTVPGGPSGRGVRARGTQEGTTLADPAPFNLASFDTSQDVIDVKFLDTSSAVIVEPVRPQAKCRRRTWVVAYLAQVLRHAEEYGLMRNELGAVSIASILDRFEPLREATWNNHHRLALTVDRDPSKSVEVVDNRLGVRLRLPLERLQSFVECYVTPLPCGASVTVSELLENGHIKNMLYEVGLPRAPVLECLRESPLFTVDANAGLVRVRALADRVRLGVERLMASPDVKLGQKLRQGNGVVPLAWLVQQYKMSLVGTEEPPPPWELAREVGTSSVLSVDSETLSVRCRRGPALLGPPVPLPPSNERRTLRVHPRSCAAVKTLRQLMDFYFEPFFVQHCRLLLHSVEASGGEWRWRMDRLAKDIRRVGDVFQGRRDEKRDLLWKVFDGGRRFVRHVLADDVDFLELTYTPDFRWPVIVPHAPQWIRDVFLAQDDELPTLPATSTVLMSYAIGYEGPSSMVEKKKWQRRLVRQFTSYSPDVVCVQRCEAHISGPVSHGRINGMNTTGSAAENTLLAAFCEHFELDNFEWFAVPLGTSLGAKRQLQEGQATAIFWKRSKWRSVSCHVCAPGSVVVRLSPFASSCPGSHDHSDVGGEFSVSCLCSDGEREMREQLEVVRSHLKGPMAICGSFGVSHSTVGSALRAAGLCGFRSVHGEVLGEELPWTALPEGRGTENDNILLPDGIWVGDRSSLVPLAALGGHTQVPPRTAQGVSRDTHPADHIPLVVALEYTPSQSALSDAGRFGGYQPDLACGGA